MTGWLLAAALAGCVEYDVELQQLHTSPVEVHVGDTVEIPAGILVTVEAIAYKNGEPLERTDIIELEVALEGDNVVDLWPVTEEEGVEGLANFALAGVAPGESELQPYVKGHPTEPIPVVVTEQIVE